MPRSGGTYSLPSGNPVVSGTTVSSTVHNATMVDIAAALTASVAKDGQTVPTANLPMGGYRHTNVDDAGARTDYVRADQAQDGTLVYLTSPSGTNTITATAPLSLAAYAAGQSFRLIPAATNTGATTININSIGAKSVFYNGAACVGNELIISVPAELFYDGTQFHIIANGASYAPVLLSSQSASASATIDFTGLSSTFSRYKITLDNVKPATDDVYLALRVGTGAGPTYQSSGYSWGHHIIGVAGDATDGSGTISTLIALTRIGAGQGVGNGTGEYVAGELAFTLPGASDFPLIRFDGVYMRSDAVGQGATVVGNYGGAGAYTALRFLFSSGNIASGTFKLYGIR